MKALGRSSKELADWRTLYRPLCLKLFRAYEGILRVSSMLIECDVPYHSSSVYALIDRKGKR